MVGTAFVYNAFTASVLQCFCRSCQVSIAEKKVCRPPTNVNIVVQRPPKKVGFVATEVRCTEQAKGGIKYELVLAEPALEAPKLSSPPKSSLSVEEIHNKLRAAEERRASLEAQKINSVIEKMSHLNEVKGKKEEFNNNFMQTARDSLERKMESNKENREAYIKSIQEKARDHVLKIEEVKKTIESPQKKETLMEEFNKKMNAASLAREANINASKERLREHDMHISNVRKQMEESVESNESKRESLIKKLNVAAEKRETIIQEIRERMKDHDKHITDAQRQREEYAEMLREKQTKRLESAEEKRNAYIKEIQEKNKEHKSHVLHIRQLNMINQQDVEVKLQKIVKKLDEAESKRMTQFQTLHEKLQKHERHVEEVRRKAMSVSGTENSSG